MLCDQLPHKSQIFKDMIDGSSIQKTYKSICEEVVTYSNQIEFNPSTLFKLSFKKLSIIYGKIQQSMAQIAPNINMHLKNFAIPNYLYIDKRNTASCRAKFRLNCVLTMDKKCKFHLSPDSLCPLCESLCMNFDHLFFDCPALTRTKRSFDLLISCFNLELTKKTICGLLPKNCLKQVLDITGKYLSSIYKQYNF
jgi:hypothetical protein